MSPTQDLASRTDYDHLVPAVELDQTGSDRMFQKLFYSSGVCSDQAGLEFRLRARARQLLRVETDQETGEKVVRCR